mgnify:FL=1
MKKKYNVRASQTQYIIYETEVVAKSKEEAEEIALTIDLEKWDDENVENADSLSIDDVEEIEERIWKIKTTTQ